MHEFGSLSSKLFSFVPFARAGDVWEQSETVNQYKDLTELYYPEQLILDLIKQKEQPMKMLDLGVGAGRTTAHFAPLMKEYVGIDSSKKMIEACKKKFCHENFVLKVVDAKNLSMFGNEEFDFVLFSFNGLDCMCHEDRLKTLMEVYRVLKNGGYFCFSSHNLNWVWKYWVIKKAPLRLFVKRIYRILLFRFCNRKIWKALRKQYRRCDHMVVADGPHNFGVKNYHIAPCQQIKQLKDYNFREFKAYNRSGNEPDSSKLETDSDGWIYYVCKK